MTDDRLLALLEDELRLALALRNAFIHAPDHLAKWPSEEDLAKVEAKIARLQSSIREVKGPAASSRT